jgi:VCBS repeat-containing protein
VLSNDIDPDNNDTHSVIEVNDAAFNVGAAVSGSQGGSFTIDGDGSYTFNPGSDFNNLAVGENRITSVYYTNVDNNGASSIATLTVTVSGVNDAPVAVADMGTTAENSVLIVPASAGVLSNDTDLDISDTHGVGAVNNSLAGNVGVAVAGTHGGSFTIAADGSYRFDPGTDFDNLAVNESRTTSVDYTNVDNHGSASSATLTVTVTGTNDAPTIVSGSTTANGQIDEISATTGSTVVDEVAGSVAFADFDLSDSHTATVVSNRSSWTGGSLSLAQQNMLTSAFTLPSALNEASGSGKQEWDFQTADANLDFIGAGQTVSVTYTLRIADNHGSSVDQDVTVSVHGANDAPAASGTYSHAVTDTAALDSFADLSGKLTATDVDTGDRLTWSGSASGNYGELTVDAGGGYSYVVNAVAVNALQAGSNPSDSFTVTVTDSQGATATRNITIDVLGANDAPVALADIGATSENLVLQVDSAQGVLSNDTDADPSDTHSVGAVNWDARNGSAVVHGSQGGSFGIAANGGYTFDPGTDFDNLAVGESRDTSFTYTNFDNHGGSSSATLTVTVTGTNDAPTIVDSTHVSLPATDEDTTSTVTPGSALLAAAAWADVDAGAASGIAVTAVSARGTWQYSTDGSTWTDFGPLSATQALLLTSASQIRYVPDHRNGETASLSFKAWDQTSGTAGTLTDTTVDGWTTSFSSAIASANVTVGSVNDAPTVIDAAELTLSATTGNTVSSATAVATVLAASGWEDVDSDAVSGIAVTSTTANGNWQYSTDGLTWTDFGAVSATHALLLSSTSQLRYAADPQGGETANFAFEAWDQTEGNASVVGAADHADAAVNGGTSAFSIGSARVSISVAPGIRTLVVDSFAATDSGFTLHFNRAFDPAKLNLYDSQAARLGPADIVLTGPSGVVKGSVVFDADHQGISFVRSGGALPAGRYSVTLASRADAFTELSGELLDGNSDNHAGDDYVMNFNVSAAGALLSLSDIARGPGQALNQAASASGLPVSLSNAAGANRVDFTLNYNPALLDISGVSLGAGAPAGSTLITDLSQAGRLTVSVRFGAMLTSAAAIELVRLQAAVPLSAADLYGQKQILDLSDVAINQDSIAVRADDAIALNAYLGDATANRGYDTLDVQRLQRVVTGLDTGLAAYPLLDPAIVGDTTGDGLFNSVDVLRLQQKVLGLPVNSIPPLPSPALPLRTFSGADPSLRIGTAQAHPGATVVVTVEIDQVAGLESVQMTLAYPSQWLTLTDLRLVGAMADAPFSAIHKLPAGTVLIDVSRLTPAGASGPAPLFELEFRVDDNAPAGAIAIDMQSAALNNTELTLNPTPQPGPDSTDGQIVVSPTAVTERTWTMADDGVVAWPQRPLAAAQATDTPMLDFSAGLKPYAKDIVDRPAWLGAFVNHLGQAPATSPNAGLRVTLPIAVKTTNDVSRLGRQ